MRAMALSYVQARQRVIDVVRVLVPDQNAESAAFLASLGRARPKVYRMPRVAVVATGDELVNVDEMPGPAQIRNSNQLALSAQVERAGGLPWRLPIARDDEVSVRTILEQSLAEA